MPGNGEHPGESNQIALDGAVHAHRGPADNQIRVNRLACRNDYGLTAPDFRGRGRLRQKNGQSQGRHQRGSRRGSPETAPQQSDRAYPQND